MLRLFVTFMVINFETDTEGSMERPKLKEVLGAPVAIVKFIGERLLGGGWDHLPNTATREPRPPVRANITYFSTPEGPDAGN